MHIRRNNKKRTVYRNFRINPSSLHPFSLSYPAPSHARQDPKHVSGHSQRWLADNNICWWRTPPESPDLNPIENVWHELKEYIRREIKPPNKDKLVNGTCIPKLWRTVAIEKCRKYIGHLQKVIPRVIELEGQATGY